MASTVSANGLAVATSSSSHYAVTIADIRLVNRQVPTPLPNFIASEHIARGYPTTVLFDEGKVWNVPVEVGDPPKSNPVDTWPGAKSQAINSFASAAPGAGSPNVFVAGKKVLCFSHTTEQNARNSFGIITDKPGLDKLLKEYEDSLAKQKAKPDVDSTSQSRGGGAGKGGQAAPPPAVPQPPPAEAKKEQGCAIAGVLAADGDRKQKDRNPAHIKSLLEVIAGSKVDLEAKEGTAMCGQHPIWSCAANGWTGTGLKTEFRTPQNTVSATGALSLLTIWTTRPNVKATVYTITLADCLGGGKFQRDIFVLPGGNVSAPITGFGPFGAFGGGIQKVLGRTGLDFTWDVKVMAGKLAFEGGWQAAESTAHTGKGAAAEYYDYKCYYAASLKGSVVVLDGTAKLEYSLFRLPIPGPIMAFLRGIELLNKVTNAITGRDLITANVFVSITGQLAANLGIEVRKYYNGSFNLMPKATFDITGQLTGSIGVRVAALDSKAGAALASGTGSANLSVTASGAILKNWPPGVQGKLTLNRPTLTLVLAYDLTVLIYTPQKEQNDLNARGGWGAFWDAVTSPIQTVKKGWSKLSDSVRKEIADSLGEQLKGSRTYSMAFGWDDKNLDTGEWRLPIG